MAYRAYVSLPVVHVCSPVHKPGLACTRLGNVRLSWQGRMFFFHMHLQFILRSGLSSRQQYGSGWVASGRGKRRGCVGETAGPGQPRETHHLSVRKRTVGNWLHFALLCIRALKTGPTPYRYSTDNPLFSVYLVPLLCNTPYTNCFVFVFLFWPLRCKRAPFLRCALRYESILCLLL